MFQREGYRFQLEQPADEWQAICAKNVTAKSVTYKQTNPITIGILDHTKDVSQMPPMCYIIHNLPAQIKHLV